MLGLIVSNGSPAPWFAVLSQSLAVSSGPLRTSSANLIATLPGANGLFKKGDLAMKRFLVSTLVAFQGALLSCPSTAWAHEPLLITKLADRKVTELPPGPLFWRLENFPTVALAQEAAGPWALVAEADGKAWLFTLGPAGGSTAGGTQVAELGPIPRVVAPQYLLQINEARGAPGSITPVHTHPGSEAFYVLAGETSSHTPAGTQRVAAGHAQAGNGADTPMQVSSSGAADLHSLVMFLVDAHRPFSSPATLP